MKHKSGCSIGREGGEAGKGEWCKMENGAVGILRIEWHAVLYKHNTKPLQELEKLSQSDVPIEARLAHSDFKRS